MASFDAPSLMVLALLAVAGAYFLAYAMDGVMGPDGFGTVPNTIILVAGGFIGLYAARELQLPVTDTTMKAVVSVSGGFLSLALLAILKALANRMGY